MNSGGSVDSPLEKFLFGHFVAAFDAGRIGFAESEMAGSVFIEKGVEESDFAV